MFSLLTHLQNKTVTEKQIIQQNIQNYNGEKINWMFAFH